MLSQFVVVTSRAYSPQVTSCESIEKLYEKSTLSLEPKVMDFFSDLMAAIPVWILSSWTVGPLDSCGEETWSELQATKLKKVAIRIRFMIHKIKKAAM